jgi:hypothetical protein
MRRSALRRKAALGCPSQVATTIIPDSRGSLAFIGKFLYKIQPNQFYTVLLYNRGTEPQTILFYHTDEVQVPQVPRM